jgi:hypothetical protein
VPRSARASVSLDALEFQSHLSSSQIEYGYLGTSLSPETSSHDLPDTPEQLMSGYSTPHDPVYHMGARPLNQWADRFVPLNPTPDYSFNASSLRDCSGSIDAESWTMSRTPDASSVSQSYPSPAGHKEAQQLIYPQGWEYSNFPAPSHGLSYLPGYEAPNYTSQSLVPSTSSWHGPEFISAYNVPGHAPIAHTGDLSWPSEWVNDSY